MNIRRKLLLSYMIATPLAYLGAQNTIKVTDLDLSHYWQEYGDPMKGKSVTGEDARIGTHAFTDVIGTHAKSLLKINLKGSATHFTCRIGLADSEIKTTDPNIVANTLVDGTKLFFRLDGDNKQFAGISGKSGEQNPGSAFFVLKGDGRELFRSKVMRTGEQPLDVNIDLKKVKILEMLVEPTQDGPSGDHALWIAPIIAYTDRKPETVAANVTAEGPKQSQTAIDNLSAKIKALPAWNGRLSASPSFDWLITPERAKAGVYAADDGKSIILANPMVSRTIRLFPNIATTDYVNRMTGESLLRAVSSEGSIVIDGKRHNLGGLSGQPERAYLKEEWIEQMTTVPGSFVVEDFEVKELKATLQWKQNRWAMNTKPGTGKEVIFTLRGEDALKNVTVRLSICIYDQLPLIRKSFKVENDSQVPVRLESFDLEYLSMSEPGFPGGGNLPVEKFPLPNIHIESDYACSGSFTEQETDFTENWVKDPDYHSQVDYEKRTPCILKVAPDIGPDQIVRNDQPFESFHVWEMPLDSYDRERIGMFKKRMYRAIAPWVTQNPIFLHLTSTDPKVVREAVDQCAEVGYEMIIFSFGSGLNYEDESPENIAKVKGFVDYAHSKGIEIGGYSLFASRWISDEVDVINPATGKRGGARFGSSPCACSEWGYEYFRKVKNFYEKTGMDCFEHDGSYPGDVCASTTHKYHKGLNDSKWNQFRKVTELYRWMCANGIYINVPDFYFLNGSTKVGIGYRESNWSLPRDRQLIHTRQLNYNCTWDRLPSSVWSFVPLVQYQGGGAAATLEPLKDHLYEYKTLMVQNYGAGVQACYRGPRLYDTDETKAVVKEVISWYKKYREILNSEIVHLRKPDARDWDGIMHVNPQLKEKGFALLFNPTDKEITREIKLPLYYTGLEKTAKVRKQEGKSVKYKLDRNYNITVTAKIPAGGYTWYVIE